MVERLRAAYDESRSARGRLLRETVARWLDASSELVVLNRMAFGDG
jgi:hypothetical protein